MSFVPVLSQSGLQGWNFLSRTASSQREVFSETGEVSREVEHFKEKISEIKTAEQLVNDRALLSVALTAFGLEDDIDNVFLIQKVLTDGSFSDDALANRFSDKRYLALTKAFGFGDFDVPRTQLSDFPDEIISSYIEKSFEIAVGNQDEDMRLALSFDREVLEIASKDSSDDTKWLEVLGNTALKSMVTKSFFLPDGFDSLDLDKQVETLKSRTAAQYGSSSLDVFLEQDNRDMMRTRFLLASQLDSASGFDSASTALTLLQSSVNLSY